MKRLDDVGFDRPMSQKDRSIRRWALLRLGLGMLQVIGAITGFILLLQTGPSTLTVAVATVTAFFMAISLTLFRGK